VIGFYSLFIALAFAITGLAFAFPGFKKTYIATFNLFQQEAASTALPVPTQIPLAYEKFQDNALYYSLKNYPQAEMLSIRLKKETEQEVDIQIRRYEKRSGVFNWLYFDRKEASLKQIKTGDSLRFGDKLGSLNYDIHTGSIGGMGTKIIAFIASLFCASLPITGYIIWLNKSKKTKKKKGYQHYVNKYC